LLPAAHSSRLRLPCWRLNRLRVSRLREACNRWMPGSEFIAEAQMNALRKMMEPDDVDQHRFFGCFALDAARSGIGDRKCRKYNFRQELLAKRGKANRAGPNGYLATRPKICVRLWSGILATRTGTECRRISLALSRRPQVPLVPPTAYLRCRELSDAAAPAIANLCRRLDGIALPRKHSWRLERFSVDVNRNSKGVPKGAQIRFGLLWQQQ